uniref:Uncharacterized protein n=1 Tax=Macrostomum lignano TaxID=282301 RepID=A0A1I8FGJ7_9PLAT
MLMELNEEGAGCGFCSEGSDDAGGPRKRRTPSRCVEPGAKKEALPRLGLTKPAVVPVVITASSRRRLTAKTRRPSSIPSTSTSPTKDEGEAASELEDGEVSPTNNKQ